MARQRVKQQTDRQIEELPRPQEELTAEQAEAVEGGVFDPWASPVLQEAQIGSGVLMPNEPKPKPKLPIDVIAPIGVP